MKCKICTNYDFIDEKCCNCEFEFDEDLYWNNDEKWDILELDDDYEWSHLQIMYRLKSKNIECITADIWWDNDLAIIIGADKSVESVAEALGVSDDVVYDAGLKPLYIINLFKEKWLRGYFNDVD